MNKKTNKTPLSTQVKNKKNNPSLMEKIEKTYGKDFGINNDKNLDSFLIDAGYPSLASLLRDGN